MLGLCKKIFSLTSKRKFLIAYSGGMDSHVLLHMLVMLQKKYFEIELRAVHINHGLSANADAWVRQCKKVCDDLKLELIVKNINVKNNLDGHSLEAISRELRYQELGKLLHEDEVLLTAHHADDQAETVLLQLFRGSGTKGLAAMPEHRGFAHSSILRPLLNFTRQELQQYAVQNKLNWIEDESNENIGFDRNFVRHKLMPIIKQRWSGIVTVLGRVAEHCSQASDMLEILAEQDYARCVGSNSDVLSASKLFSLDEARQNNVIRYWLQKLKLPTPSAIKLQHIRTDVLCSRADANPIVHWQGCEVRKFKDDLYAMLPLEGIDINKIRAEILRPEVLKQYNINPADVENIEIRFRQGGEKMKIKGRAGTHSLKKLMQEWNIPSWQRDRIPLLYCNDELIAVVDYY